MSEQEPETEAADGQSELTAGLGEPLHEAKDVKRLREDVDFLWSLLDDIDTASDIAKADDKLYRAMVEAMQSRRFERVTSDGYSLFMVPNLKVTGAPLDEHGEGNDN